MTAPATVSCCRCAADFDGTRSEARRACWEPYSYRSQWSIDNGPMVCPECVRRAIDACLDALRVWAAAQ